MLWFQFSAILGYIFVLLRFLGLGWFLSVLTQIYINLRNWKTNHNCLESEVYQIERGGDHH